MQRRNVAGTVRAWPGLSRALCTRRNTDSGAGLLRAEKGQKMGSPASDSRPLSPFTTIWRWHVTMVTSILHRLSGVALYGGAFVLVAWLIAAAMGQTVYGRFAHLAASVPGQIVLFGLTLAICFHLLNGVRYLIWDTGAGYEKQAASRSAWVVMVLSVVLAVAIWVTAYSGFGLLKAGG